MATIFRPQLKRMLYRLIKPYLDRLVDPAQAIHNPYLSAKLFPLQRGRTFSVIRPIPAARPPGASDSLPVPPSELWEGYGANVDDYLSCGRDDMNALLRTLRAAGAAPEQLPRVLDFGCAAARMLRFYPRGSVASELWGVDIKAEHIAWCQQNLPPPFRFATTTTAPHLPFEDNYFDLVYCGSVFTHISDLADAWLLELRRILHSGGYGYITIHDKHTLDLLFTKYRGRADYQFLTDMIQRVDLEAAILSGDFLSFSIGSEPKTQVFYDADYLVKKWSPFVRVLSVTPEAYGYQTALLIQKC